MTKLRKTAPCPTCGTARKAYGIETGPTLRERRTGILSLRAMAASMGVAASYLSDLELGRRPWRDALVSRFMDALTRADSGG